MRVSGDSKNDSDATGGGGRKTNMRPMGKDQRNRGSSRKMRQQGRRTQGSPFTGRVNEIKDSTYDYSSSHHDE
eukprot:CAMPEP_0202466744 /NCGR_PEP_ID=MMETSP1360-20130828/69737_1 /ASSEMBLY_ACC=CAM_ASM_000848 /TAXON_ID=515479 /ORGANISM="Licmophora paradoxa, Strain CCMP2313" /LENGTH=72 /DNA_ID=CAMNT_0049090995 /DNA_START=19 /DNA_END=234 /DNA_ORIENTATION=-